MHKINITHNDIKPQNIVYSNSLKKLVFIDFGLSEFNRQILG
jgi:tRNA A-37 threonylcarbamoyl transferase component Bud32